MRVIPKRLLAALLLAIVALAPAGRLVRAEQGRVTVYGNYYRERSTRVLQPGVNVQVHAPDERLTLGAGYLLDAITSASIAAGAMQVTGGDFAFTEFRHEAIGTVGSQLGPWQLGGHFRYSTETDYVARDLGAYFGRDFLQRTLNLTLRYTYAFNRAFALRGPVDRNPWCGGLVPTTDCLDDNAGNKNLLQVHYLGATYTHALHKQVLAQAAVESWFARGPMDNPYREATIPNGFPEAHPRERNQLALFGNLRVAFPKARLVLDPRYRFYVDDWGIRAHAVDLRLHFRLTRHLRARVRYRFYTQTQAWFYRDDMIYTGEPDEVRSGDPKMDDFMSHTPGIQLTWHLDGLARFPRLAFLEGAWIQATYNHVIYDYDDTRSIYCTDGGYLPKRVLERRQDLCGVRLGSVAFSIPF